MRTAAYARYSSDAQREASLEDQLRNCGTYCVRQGWPEPVVYTDAAISGARQDRAGYNRLLNDAHHFDVILVDDLSRLSRDSIECQRAIRKLTFAGIQLIGVSDGVDTGRRSYELETGMRGLMNQAYLADLADKTHRGLTGRALAGASAGGLPYGYRVTATGQREICPDQAQVVRRIFDAYLKGHSARDIAIALNHDGEKSSRGGSWAASAIHGDMRRGIGILVNPIYCGRQVWNRSRWVKHPETGRRVRKERPEAEWIISEHPELAIIDAQTFEAVQARLRDRRLPVKGGSHPRYLLSGVLRCGECGGALVAVDRYRYGCAAAKDRGTCTSKVHVPRAHAEHAMLAGIREQLLSNDAFQRFQRAVRDELRGRRPEQPAEAKAKLAAAEQLRQNILAALRAGIITPSTRQELLDAERSVAEATAALEATKPINMAQILPRAREIWRRLVNSLGSDRCVEVREAVREIIGTAKVIEQNGVIYAEVESRQIRMVAGACYVPNLTTSVRIQIGRKV